MNLRTPMQKSWWYSDKNGEAGPLSFDELVETLSTFSAERLAGVFVWRDGFLEWKPVWDIPQFAEHAPELLDVLIDAEYIDTQGSGGPTDVAFRHFQEAAPARDQTGRTISKPFLIGSALIGLLAAVGILWFQLEPKDDVSDR
jgi:GYF domain 2